MIMVQFFIIVSPTNNYFAFKGTVEDSFTRLWVESNLWEKQRIEQNTCIL